MKNVNYLSMIQGLVMNMSIIRMFPVSIINRYSVNIFYIQLNDVKYQIQIRHIDWTSSIPIRYK